MKICVILFALLFPAISISAEDDAISAYLDEINKVAAKVGEATQGQTLVQQIDVLNRFSQEYVGNYPVYDVLLQQIGTTHSFVGQHYDALHAFDRHLTESPRVSWRLQYLREWSHEEINEVFP